MAEDTTELSYWLQWRFYLCSCCLVVTLVVSSYIVWKFEGPKKLKCDIEKCKKKNDVVGTVYRNEAWETSFKVIHPGWLLAYRLVAFSMLLTVILANAITGGGEVFFYFTQWTITLVAVYFGLASVFSIYGCRHGCNRVTSYSDVEFQVDPKFKETKCFEKNVPKCLNSNDEYSDTKIANKWGYCLQIIYQICAGSVLLTDCTYWGLIYPILNDFDDVAIIDILLHTINAVFLVGEMLLNSIRFPFFRLAHFLIWTLVYVIFQAVLHFYVSLWWPYPFLDLSDPLSPVWYLGVGLIHIPCYGAFYLAVRLKIFCFSRLFPNTFQCKMW